LPNVRVPTSGARFRIAVDQQRERRGRERVAVGRLHHARTAPALIRHDRAGRKEK
jgi:hypothetical protein